MHYLRAPLNKHDVKSPGTPFKCPSLSIIKYGSTCRSKKELMQGLKLSWTNKATNKEIVERVTEKPYLLKQIAQRKWSFFGHI